MRICGIKNSSSSSFQLLLHLLPRFFLPEQAVGLRVYSFGCRVSVRLRDCRVQAVKVQGFGLKVSDKAEGSQGFIG